MASQMIGRRQPEQGKLSILLAVIMLSLTLFRFVELPTLNWGVLQILGSPLGFTFGRIGNFINGELYGRVTDSWIGMYFPNAGDDLLRHPSQLYEAFFEGIVVFIAVWSFRKKSPFPGFLSGLYIFGYGFVRFFIEFFRQPDAHLGFVFLKFSMGQVLCFFMLLAAGLVWYLGYTQHQKELAKTT